MKNEKQCILEDILVLDLADEKGGYCTRILADLGADVIKVEEPQGDPSRHLGPFSSTLPDGASFNLSFTYNNINKRSIALDRQTEKGKRIFETLLQKADVLVETFPPQFSKNLNLTPTELNSINPQLIHLSISPFGLTGPKSSHRSSDSIAAATGGQTFVCRDGQNRPVKLHGMQPYYTASLYGALAVLLHLRRHKTTGFGCHIDLSIQEAVASTLDHVMVDFFSNDRLFNSKDSFSYDRNFTILPCKDGYILMAIHLNWETLVELMAARNMAQGLTGKEWEQQTFREKHFIQIVEIVKEWTRVHTKRELFELGQTMRFPWAPVEAPEEVVKSPQLHSRRFFIKSDLSGNGAPVILPGRPFTFSSLVQTAPKPVPSPGEHTGQILKELDSNTQTRDQRLQNIEGCCPNERIMNGIQVLDLTRMLSGPYCTRILADSGAEVIKVQTAKTAQGAERNDTAYFRTWNRNKQSVTLDLSMPEARECFLKLAAISGIVVENYSPRVMSNWGLTYEQIKEVNPSIIMLSISAMGQTGPWKDYVGFGPTFHALSGLISASSAEAAPPTIIGHAYGDIIIGLYGACAILAALEYRDKTGEGQHIDLSGYEALCTFLGPTLMQSALSGGSGSRDRGYENRNSPAPDQCYRCMGVDRWCAITVTNDKEWLIFCNILDDPDLNSNRFATQEGRRKNLAELNDRIERWTTGNSAETVAEILQRAGIAATVVQNAEDLANDAQLAYRNFFVSTEHPALGTITSDRSALFPPPCSPTDWRAAPLLGGSNYDILVRRLGLPEETYRSFIRKGVIG